MSKKPVFILIILLLYTCISYGFDRSLIHENRLDSKNISYNSISIKNNNLNLASNISDWLISQSVSPATFTQDNSSVAALGDSAWLIIFNDNRNGSEKIFLQQIDSDGNFINSNVLAASSSSANNLIDPIVKTDQTSHVYLFYRNKSEGLIYGKKFNSDLTVNLDNFLINDTSSDSFAGPFDFDVYPDGKIVVVWENYSALGSTIQLRTYAPSGISTLGPVTVNTDGGSVSHWVPSVAVDPSGNFVVGWEDYRNGRADIFIRLYNGAGVAIGSELAIVPPPHNSLDQYTPRLAFSQNDNFIIGWVDRRSNQEIYIQNYNASTGLVAGNIMVSSGDAQFINWNLSLAVSPADNLLTTWAAFGPQNNIQALKFNTGLTPIGTPSVVNSSSIGRRWKPSAVYNPSGLYAVAWTEFESGNSDIHFNIFDSDNLSTIPAELKINDDALGAVSANPFVIPVTDWYNMIVFEDQRNDAGDIFVRTISNTGINLTGNHKINQDTGFNLQSQPSSAASITQEKTLVLWVDSRDVASIPGQRIFARFGNKFGVFSDDEFIVSDSQQTAVKTSPKAAMDANGKTLISWADKRDGSSQIYGRWINPDESFNGTEFIISDPVNDSSNIIPHLACDNQNRFYVIWLDKGKASPLVRIKWYNSDGSLGDDFNWSSAVAIDEISVAIRPSGNIVLLWTGISDGHKLFLSELTNDGTVIGTDLQINDDINSNPGDPHIAVGNNDYISTIWIDQRLGRKAAYYQILDNSSIFVGNNTPVSENSVEQMLTPATSAFNGRAWFTWVDPRNNGMNVYANNFVYLSTDVIDNQTLLPSNHQLYQNYPNPFNPTTEISFNLGSKSKVRLTIFNLLGQEVKVLSDDFYNAGFHKVVWDGTDNSSNKVASGIYLYRLETDDFVESKKMLLLK